MRIVDSMQYANHLHNIGKRREDVDRSTEQLSSGQKFSRPSEDPNAAQRVLGLDRVLESLKSYENNISRGRIFLQSTDSALAEISNLLAQARTIAVGGSSQGAVDRGAQALEVQSILDEVGSKANTEVDGVYVFAGLKNDSEPFDAAGSPPWSGDPTEFEVEVNRGVRRKVTINGQDAFTGSTSGGVNLFDLIAKLRDDLNSNDPTQVATNIGEIDKAIDQANRYRSEVGVRMNQLDMAQNVLKEVGMARTKERSDLADTDVVAAVTELNLSQKALEGALRATSLANQKSLLDFI